MVHCSGTCPFQKCSSRSGSKPHTWFSLAHTSLRIPSNISIGSSVFAQLTGVPKIPTTVRATCAGKGHIYGLSAMRPETNHIEEKTAYILNGIFK